MLKIPESWERQAVDLSRAGIRRKDSLEAFGHAHDTGKQFWTNPELKAAYDIARRYEHDHGQAIKAYAAGWPKMVNWQTCGQAASNTTFTTLQQIGVTQQQNIFPQEDLAAPPIYWKFEAFGIVGSAAGTATTTFGVDLNNTGTAVMISASQTPATSTVNVWRFYGSSVLLTSGSAGTIQSSGDIVGINATAATSVLIPATQAAAATFNTTVANYFNLVASWSASAAGNLYGVNGFAVLQYN